MSGSGVHRRRVAGAQFPYWSVSDFSMRMAWATCSATGRCSTPAGTTNNSPARSTSESASLHVDVELTVPTEEQLILVVVMPGELSVKASNPNDRAVDRHEIGGLPRPFE